MSINNGSGASGINHSYSGSTGYTSGASLKINKKINKHSASFDEFNTTMPTKLFANFALNTLDANCVKPLLAANSSTKLTITTNQKNSNYSLSHSNNYENPLTSSHYYHLSNNLNNKHLNKNINNNRISNNNNNFNNNNNNNNNKINKSDSLLDSSTSSTSNCSHYSSLFSR